MLAAGLKYGSTSAHSFETVLDGHLRRINS
jgi:hypothetical protein